MHTVGLHEVFLPKVEPKPEKAKYHFTKEFQGDYLKKGGGAICRLQENIHRTHGLYKGKKEKGLGEQKRRKTSLV